MRKKVICLSIVLFLCLGIVLKINIIPFYYKNIDSAYGISSSNSTAVDVGMKVLKSGGNAIDAAAAISYVLGVVEPYSSGIGGGGCMLIYFPETKDYKFYNYREKALINSDTRKSTIGTPGLVKGIEEIQSKHGKLNMSDLIQYSIDLAQNGFKMNENLYYKLSQDSSLEKYSQFYSSKGKPKSIGDTVIQEDLAQTLIQIKENGSKAFYYGVIAQELIKEGYVTKEDLQNYDVKEQETIKGSFNGYDIVTAPPPFSGITLIQILNMIEYMDVPSFEENPVKYIEDMHDITNIAYTSRQANISDPAFAEKDKDYQKLATKKYAKYIYNKYDNIYQKDSESKDTTSFVVIDKDGMVVSCTNTLGELFGSKKYVGGFFLNNSSANFNENENSINSYAPEKQSRTFISPAIITKEYDYIMGIGSPGANSIPQVLAQVINANLRDNIDLEDAVEMNRFLFDEENEVLSEKMISPEIISQIIDDGNNYSVVQDKSKLLYGSIHAIVKDRNEGIYGASDSRRRGEYKVKY